MKSNLQKKIDVSLRLIKSISEAAQNADSELELCYSAGKDSDVLLTLTKMANVPYRAIFRNTTIDPPGTIKHAKDNGAEIRQPKMTFREIIQSKGYPTRLYRFCCQILKEYKILDFSMVGVRADESRKRSEYKEPSICRVYRHKERVQMMMPILAWTTEDVQEFVQAENIKCHPWYYDNDNVFHAEKRLGCIGCPIANWKHRITEFQQYPGFVKMWVKAGQQYLDTHPQIKAHQYFSCAEEMFVYNLYCNSMKEYEKKFPTQSRYKDFAKNHLQETFKIQLL